MRSKGKQTDASHRPPLWQRIRAEYDRATLSCCRVEMMGCGQMLIQSCTEILEYGRERIRLAVRDPDARQLVICGSELICLSYHPDAVSIKGCICTVTFCRACDDQTEAQML